MSQTSSSFETPSLKSADSSSQSQTTSPLNSNEITAAYVFDLLKVQIEYIDKEVKPKIKEFEDSFNDKLNTLNKEKLRTIELMSFFIGFFTFISVEAKFFEQKMQINEIVGFSLVIAGLLLAFIAAMNILISDNIYRLTKDKQPTYLNWKTIIFYLFVTSLVILGIVISQLKPITVNINFIQTSKINSKQIEGEMKTNGREKK